MMADLRTLLLGLLACTPFIATAAPAVPVVTGYVFPQNAALRPGQVNARGMNRINYAFARIKDGRMVEGFSTDAANLAQVTALRRENPGLLVLISVGGWTWSDGFSDAALTKRSRAVLIESAIDFLKRYDLDGLDLDWEYPGQAGSGHSFRSEDKQNFTLLIAELRARLDQETRKTRRKFYLTIAAGASDEYLTHTEMAKVQKYVNAVNLMTYDYYGAESDAVTGNHAALMTDPADPKKASADASVKAFERAGVPARKILLGVAFYGKPWGDVSNVNHGLFQPGRPDAGGDVPYSAIKGSLLEQGFTRYWDATAQAPYLYSEEKREFVSYDDPESIAAKCKYVLTHKLGGVVFWSYFNDPSGELVGAIDQALHGAAKK